jgi:hypothetical protein
LHFAALLQMATPEIDAPRRTWTPHLRRPRFTPAQFCIASVPRGEGKV